MFYSGFLGQSQKPGTVPDPWDKPGSLELSQQLGTGRFNGLTDRAQILCGT